MLSTIKKRNIIAVALVLTSIFGAATVNANTYRGGEFRVTIREEGENGRTYRGCDAKGNCIKLNHGTSWRYQGSRGITWENGEYTYSVSWKESSSPMHLKVFRGSKLILQRQLVPVN